MFSGPEMCMPTEIRPLPVIVTPGAGESGPSFLLRVAQSNGLALKAMLGWLGISSLQTLTPMMIRSLAYATEAPHAWLQKNLVLWMRRDRFFGAEWLGHHWSSSLSLRGAHPQICPDCLREEGSCQSAWEMTGQFGCTRHGRLLADRCSHCGTALTWMRPAVDVCTCGRYLTAASRTQPIDPDAACWLDLLGARLQNPEQVGLASREIVPWLAHLSPDGAFTVVYAAGVRVHPNTRVPLSSRVNLSPSTVAEIVGRGVQRLREEPVGEKSCSDRFRGLVYEQALERLNTRGEAEADRCIAGELLSWVGSTPRRGLSLTGRRPLGQLDLFSAGGLK